MNDDGAVERAVDIWHEYVTPLIESGFSYGEVEWLLSEADFRGSPDGFAATAVAYRAAGFTAQETSHWHALVGHVDVAIDLANAGWTPNQYDTLWERVRARTWSTVDPPPSYRSTVGQVYGKLSRWADTGLPPALVLQFVAAGIHPTEAVTITANTESVHDLARQLAVLAALRP